VSHDLRNQVGRRRRALERTGTLRVRVVRDGPALAQALDDFFRLEGSGWKTEAGTAILTDPPLEQLYRAFAFRAAESGWLRLFLLEVDGQAVAGTYGCSFGGSGHLLKTGYDVRFAKSSPGLILMAEVLRHGIEEGLTNYDFLGGADPYKLRWTSTLKPRIGLRAYRGPSTLPEALYWQRGRPALRWLALRTMRRKALVPRKAPAPLGDGGSE
jgi:CelD/BcsL family acetyltransferase involved in cellulose biosynthesis